jgi:hypothetical protein
MLWEVVGSQEGFLSFQSIEVILRKKSNFFEGLDI